MIHHLRAGGYLLCPDCRRATISKVEVEVTRLNSPSRANPESVSRHLDFCRQEPNTNSTCRHCRSPKVAIAAPEPNIFLWLHTLDEPSNDWSPQQLEAHLNLLPRRDIHYTENHKIGTWKSPHEMPALYQIWDALLFLSGGEGFGIPAWEAMCSGLPVIYTNYSSHAEFLNAASAGLPVGGILQPEPKTCILRLIADLEQALEAVGNLFSELGLRELLGENGIQFSRQFTPNLQAAAWNTMFRTLLGHQYPVAGSTNAQVACDGAIDKS